MSDETKDYRVTVSVSNARITERIAAMGYDSRAKFCDEYNINYQSMVQLVNMHTTMLDAKGEVRPIIMRLAEIFECEPDELFTERQAEGFKKSSSSALMSESEMLRLTNPVDMDRSIALIEMADHLLRNKNLTDRERLVIKCRFTDDETLLQVAERLGVGQERVRQIEAKALRKMRHKTCGGMIEDDAKKLLAE